MAFVAEDVPGSGAFRQSGGHQAIVRSMLLRWRIGNRSQVQQRCLTVRDPQHSTAPPGHP